MTTRKWDAWNYRESTGISARQDNLTGFKVHAVDGDIGKIDEATREVGGGYVVVDTGPWIFGKKVLLPAGVAVRIFELRVGLDVREKLLERAFEADLPLDPRCIA